MKEQEGAVTPEVNPYNGNRIAIFDPYNDTVTIYEYGKEPVTIPRADYKFCSE